MLPDLWLCSNPSVIASIRRSFHGDDWQHGARIAGSGGAEDGALGSGAGPHQQVCVHPPAPLNSGG